MREKRKLVLHDDVAPPDLKPKRVCLGTRSPPPPSSGITMPHTGTTAVQHPVLSAYLHKVRTLRAHLRIVLRAAVHRPTALRKISEITIDSAPDLHSLLDTALIGYPKSCGNPKSRSTTWLSRSLRERVADAVLLECPLLEDMARTGRPTSIPSQAEIVDLALETLFTRSQNKYYNCNPIYPGKPNNILSLGYKSRRTTKGLVIENIFPNTHVSTLKGHPWTELLQIVYDEVMFDLLLNTCVFIPCTEDHKQTYYQLTGPRISDPKNNPVSDPKSNTTASKCTPLKALGDIRFIRSQIFYSPPNYNCSGLVMFGLGPRHVFNRFSNLHDEAHTLHILKYIFPREFRLQNAFTSIVGNKLLENHGFREREILGLQETRMKGKELPIPNRLRGDPIELVGRLQKLHARCSYHALINYYCPVPVRYIAEKKDLTSSTVSRTSFTDFASPSYQVSQFARAVISKVIPRAFMGNRGENHNTRVLLHNADKFINLRRYETFSLHTALQGIRLTDIDWLRPPSVSQDSRMSKSDERKRRDLLAEFVYWLFDSFLMSLLKANFYITESSSHKNRLFYFRHDVWKKISEPALSSLKLKMFQEIPQLQAEQMLAGRPLGYSRIRLLPKEHGIRPVMNLSKRVVQNNNGRQVLSPSINRVMDPVFHVLSLEKLRQPEMMRSVIANTNMIYSRVKEFRAKLGTNDQRLLYFVKVDIAGCFDAIPQDSLLKLIDTIIQDEDYQMVKYNEVRAPPASLYGNGARTPIKRWLTAARSNTDGCESFSEFSKRVLKPGLDDARVLVDDVIYKSEKKSALLELLHQHVQNNLVKVGRRYFKQTGGIPQGSVLSTILCNFFYTDMERKNLAFTYDEDGILLRLVDDFLFITPNQNNATRFLQIMHRGNPEYGAFVNSEKSMVNFEAKINGSQIRRLPRGSKEFPWCGTLIHTETLNMRRERDRTLRNVDAMLSVEYSRKPIDALFRKTVRAWSIHATGMYFDTSFNSLDTVIRNIFHNFVEVAMKFHCSVKSISQGGNKRPTRQLSSIIGRFFEVAFVIVRNKQKAPGGEFQFSVSRSQVRWLGAQAFKVVLGRKQGRYTQLLEWLKEVQTRERGALRGKIKIDPQTLDTEPFEKCRY